MKLKANDLKKAKHFPVVQFYISKKDQNKNSTKV